MAGPHVSPLNTTHPNLAIAAFVYGVPKLPFVIKYLTVRRKYVAKINFIAYTGYTGRELISCHPKQKIQNT
jgi:hypothetical protein